MRDRENDRISFKFSQYTCYTAQLLSVAELSRFCCNYHLACFFLLCDFGFSYEKPSQLVFELYCNKKERTLSVEGSRFIQSFTSSVLRNKMGGEEKRVQQLFLFYWAMIVVMM